MCTATALFQQTEASDISYGESDEDLFLALMNQKIQQQEEQKQQNFAGSGSNESMLLNSYDGAGLPRPSLGPEDIVPLLMKALQNNDFPEADAGLVSMWEFTTDTTKYIFNNNITGE